MSRETIYLHIGSPKTGTTTLQYYLAKNAGRLYDAGFLVPEEPRKINPNNIYLANYAMNENRTSRMRSICKTETRKQIISFRKRFYKALRAEIGGFNGKNVILSNEHCYQSLKYPEEIARLKDLLSGLSENVKIVLYLREQSELLCSRYSTSVKNNEAKVISRLTDFANADFYDFNKKLKLWEDVFGIENIILRIFDKSSLYEHDIISDFCKTIGIPRFSMEEVRLNTSLNVKQCEFMRIINSNLYNLADPNAYRARHQLNRMVVDTAIESPQVSMLLSKEYQQVFDSGNREIARRYFGYDGELFNKKPLPDVALDQRILLTDEDKRNLANQIIANHKMNQISLCKCIAAIFGVEFNDKEIPMGFVRRYNKEIAGRKVDFYGIARKLIKMFIGR